MTEEEFQKRRLEILEEEARYDEIKRQKAELSLDPKCPSCGSHRYIQGIYAESCSNCGYEASYW